MKRSDTNVVRKLLIYLFLSGTALFFLLPFIWMMSTSLKTPAQVWTYPPEWIPRPPSLRSYFEIWTMAPIHLFLINSFIVTGLTIVGMVLSCSMVAFGFARLRFRGRNILFVILLSSMILPPQIYMIPQYLFFTFLGWVDTFKPLYVPYWFAAYLGPFYIFLLRQFFLTIPWELDDAARIDGCSWFGIYTRIMLPLIKPALIAAVIFCFTWTWNDFLTPLIYLGIREKYTLTLGLRYFQSQYGMRYIRELMATSTISALPTLVLFFFCQRYFVEGISISGVKK